MNETKVCHPKFCPLRWAIVFKFVSEENRLQKECNLKSYIGSETLYVLPWGIDLIERKESYILSET